MVAKSPGGLTVQVTSFVKSHKMRELSDLEVKVLPHSQCCLLPLGVEIDSFLF